MFVDMHVAFRLPLKLSKIVTGMYYTYISYQYRFLLLIQLENNMHIQGGAKRAHVFQIIVTLFIFNIIKIMFIFNIKKLCQHQNNL